MATNGVLYDRHENFRDIRIELETFRHIDRPVQLDRVGIVVADFRIGQIERKEIDGLLSTDINYSQMPAFWYFGNIVIGPRGHDGISYNVSGNRGGGAHFAFAVQNPRTLHLE